MPARPPFLVALLLLAALAPAAEGTAEAPFISDADWNRSTAAAPPAPGREQAPPGGRAFLATAGALALVVGLAAVSLVVLRRVSRGRGGPGRGRHCTIVDTVALGPRRAVSLLRVGEHLIVVGQSEHGLAGLGTLPASALGADAAPPPEPPSTAPSAAAPAAPRDGAFAAALDRLLGRRR